MVNEQVFGSLPVHAPLQPVKLLPFAIADLRLTAVPAGYVAEQVPTPELQLIVVSGNEEVTVTPCEALTVSVTGAAVVALHGASVVVPTLVPAHVHESVDPESSVFF
jgi:hypothetical protein